jgi:hypothetical protein
MRRRAWMFAFLLVVGMRLVTAMTTKQGMPKAVSRWRQSGSRTRSFLAIRCLRVADGGEVLDEVTTSQAANACMLGGPDGRHLFVTTAPDSASGECAATRAGRMEIAEVAVPHAGLPWAKRQQFVDVESGSPGSGRTEVPLVGGATRGQGQSAGALNIRCGAPRTMKTWQSTVQPTRR